METPSPWKKNYVDNDPLSEKKILLAPMGKFAIEITSSGPD